MLVTQGEGSGTLTEPHHTPFPEAQQSPLHDFTSPSQLTETTEPIPTVTPSEIPTLRQYSKRARIAQSKALPTAADEPVSPLGDDTNILTSEVQVVSVPPAAEVSTVGIPTGSGMVPTASPIFTTASVVTPYSRRKDKENMVESDTPKKKKQQEHIDVQVAREMEEQMAREDQKRNEQIARDAKIARIHAEEELQMLIDGLDKNNEVIARHLHDKSLSKKQQREFYMSDLKSHSGWKIKHFKGMTLEEIREKFIPVWKQIEDFVPMASKEDGGRFKRKGLRLEQSSAKKMKTAEDVFEEDLKEMMQLVLVEEVYVEALQVKHPIIDWEIHTKGKRYYWKIIRLGGHTAVYQFFVDMLKQIDREDLNYEEVPTASKEMFPLLSKRDATAEEVCTAEKLKIHISGTTNQTTRYSSTYDYLSVNRIDIIDVAREEYAQEILGFSNNSSCSNPTSTSEPILSESSPFLTSFEGSDFILEEIEAYLKDESISLEINHADCDPEGDICLIEN
uniref:Reverse transcriptase domain-containing protein n=1 Tax=Tanacetum cinerariifolium TaxID=118510 RepID=A0A6L2MFM8_TANCI|nr:reverse transcriptase domain-containing protein [Tanacetum cinerariifolium]